MSSPSRLVIDPAMYNYPDLAGASAKNTNSAGLPPASKLLPSTSLTSNAPLTGWTPLISRTFSNEIISYNSTPSSKLLPSVYKQGANLGSAAGHQNASDFDYPGLNLTPFLTHNLNLMNNPNSAGNPSNNVFTPLYDKSLHLADFFMDSPIRMTLNVDSITPSKFSIQHSALGSAKRLDSKLNAALSLKRSITQIDTPARHPFKKYDTGIKVESDDQLDSEGEDDNIGVPPNDFGDSFVTPSKKKVLHEVPPNMMNKTPTVPNSAKGKNLYQTPAKPTLVSSPSTVIMSSAARSPENEVVKQIPPSPTPLKDKIEVSEPVMGIFSERKSKEPKPTRKPKKQLSGMNRFQIVFTDVHTLMNNRKKKTSNNSSSSKLEKTEKKRNQQRLPNHDNHSPTFSQQHQPQFLSFQQGLSSLSASQDFNSTINTSREFSVLGNNSTVNTTNSNLNVTSDQSSFEIMHGGIMSTPNGKYLLDNLFDRGSPPQSINQMTSTLNHVNIEAKGHEHVRQGGQHMPPPPRAFQQATQQVSRPDAHQQMNMMMSTPQHENIINAHPGVYLQEEFSPSNKDSMAFMYHQLHQFHNMNSPGNLNLHNVHPQPLPQIVHDQQHLNSHNKVPLPPNLKDSEKKPKGRKKRPAGRTK